MRLKYGRLGILGVALLITACGAPGPGPEDSLSSSVSAQQSGVQTLTAEEAKNKMDAGGVTIVDVRTAGEYDQGHIPGAVLIPNETIGGEAPGGLPDKDAVLLIYCRSGNRSRQAAEKLSALGYQNVYDFGGITAWPYDIVSGEEAN